jgi:hypothetical protein
MDARTVNELLDPISVSEHEDIIEELMSRGMSRAQALEELRWVRVS